MHLDHETGALLGASDDLCVSRSGHWTRPTWETHRRSPGRSVTSPLGEIASEELGGSRLARLLNRREPGEACTEQRQVSTCHAVKPLRPTPSDRRRVEPASRFPRARPRPETMRISRRRPAAAVGARFDSVGVERSAYTGVRHRNMRQFGIGAYFGAWPRCMRWTRLSR